MNRAEGAGLGISAAAHAALFAILSLGLFAVPAPIVPPQQAVDVRLVDEVGLEAAVPEPATEAPAPSVAPEVGPSEPREPTPSPAPPKAVAPPQAPPVKAAPPIKATPPRATARPAEPPRGSRLGPNFLQGISDRPSASTTQTPRAVKIGVREMAGLVDAFRRQVQPCADRINNPGPGANTISTKLNLKLNRDGSFSARPVVVSQSGVDDENGRYAKRVGELAAAAFVQCAPFELPDELYDGWKNINLNYKLPE